MLLVLASLGVCAWWVPSVQHLGKAVYVDNPDTFKVFRNVKDYGAKGDGATDDTAAFNNAMSDQGRCGAGCETTRSAAYIYVPPGTYIISGAINVYYYSHFIGDVTDLPVLKASNNFNGHAVIDGNFGTNPTLNFWKAIRNFIIDMTDGATVGIHWQVAQATSLSNLAIKMRKGSDQVGINMEEGSGNFFGDIVISGGDRGAQLGNQQFTVRNVTISDAKTAVKMSWDWDFNYIGWTIRACPVGFDVSGNIASCVFSDCVFVDVDVAIKTSYADGGNSATGTVIVDNCDFGGANIAVQRGGATLLAGKQVVDSWIAGSVYWSGSATNGQGAATGVRTIGANPYKPVKPASLLKNGKWASQSIPQFPNVAAANVVNAKSKGVKADGKADDTAALQALFDGAGADDLILLDQGAYLVTDTVYLKPGLKVVGEAWPLILGGGKNFDDQANPRPVFQVGKPGETGIVQLTDLVFGDRGAAEGAIFVEWNLRAPAGRETESGMWEVHFRLCTSAGEDGGDAGDIAAFLSLHITKTATCYVEAMWSWAGDHTEDGVAAKRYSGRGILVESAEGPVWLVGTGSEHHVLYQYQIANAANVILLGLQSETAYWQGGNNPAAPKPFTPNAAYSDPTFGDCTDAKCTKGWALRIVNSKSCFLYGGGSYDFFDAMDQGCLNAENCQRSQVGVEDSHQIWLFDVNTKASTDIVRFGGLKKYIPQGDNRNTFCSTAGLYYEE